MITLSKDMETGVEKIDSQHRELISRLNTVTDLGIAASNNEETQKTLNLLGDYIKKHFSDEEALQKQSNYPKYEAHKEQHRMYINEFNKLNKEFQANGYSPQFNLALRNSIINWIVRHIKSVDVEFGKYYKAL